MKRLDCFAWQKALAVGCTVLFACSADPAPPGSGGNSAGAGNATTSSGTAGASTGSSSSTSGTTSVTTTSGAGGAGNSTTSTGSGGGAAGQGGTGTGMTGSGGAAIADAGRDVGSTGSGGQSIPSDAAVGDAAFPPITECPKPSVDRLEQWMSSGPVEGTTIPPTGNLLTMEGDHYIAKVEFVNVEWHVCPVYLGNAFSANANLSASSGFLLTYSSTSDMFVQARPTSHWSGGDQWALRIPSTGGVRKSQFFSFDAANWKSIFGTPTWTFADTLKEVLGFVFVGQTPNVVTIWGLRFDGYVPPCR